MQISTLVRRMAELLRILAAFVLVLASLTALQWMVIHRSYVIQQERTALRQINDLGKVPAPQPTIGKPGTTSNSSNGTQHVVPEDVTLPIIGGVISVDVPAGVWLVLCIVATIFFMLFVVQAWQQVIVQWKKVLSCSWTDFWSFVGCILQWIWTIIITIIAVVLTIVVVVFILYNLFVFITGL